MQGPFQSFEGMPGQFNIQASFAHRPLGHVTLGSSYPLSAFAFKLSLSSLVRVRVNLFGDPRTLAYATFGFGLQAR